MLEVEINIPGRGIINIKNLVLDYNGTIACDGKVIPSIKEKIEAIHKKGIRVHVVTADTHGTARNQCADMPIEVQIFDHSNAAQYKKEIVEKLGAEQCACIGNGFNDGQMFEACSLSIIVIGEEGCSAKSLMKADIVCKSIEGAFDLILKPSRIIATLRG
ncbi:HAD family hydrolase [Paenibacillus sp. CAU 1523]|uniref:HAD family hydrolase n=1 Tax=Paenibacillus arenosi TaxID=2774142 RepID=A0ABR9AXH8_9BACL|nr:HAD family hydrolase [Paenibacillus arenosi]MBD8497885.1 HAD family hydrolase [Paenibacillus arenosi]